MIQGIHHIGIQVNDLDEAITFYGRLGFELEMRSVYHEIEGLFAMVAKDGNRFELWQFNNPEHEKVTYIKNHVALISDDIEEDIEKLVERGGKAVISLTEGDEPIKRFATIQDADGNYIELCELADK